MSLSDPERRLVRRAAVQRMALLLGSAFLPGYKFLRLDEIDWLTLRRIVEDASRSGIFAINIAAIAAEAVRPFQYVLGTVNLSLRRINVDLARPDEIIIHGTHQLAGLSVKAELRFFNESSGIGYTLSFATDDPLKLLPDDLQHIRNVVNLDALWWTYSSRALQNATIAIENLKAEAINIATGHNFHFRFDNKVLERLGLEAKLFALNLVQGIPQFSVPLRFVVRLPPVLTVQVDHISFRPAGSVAFQGEAMFNLLGVTLNFPRIIELVPDTIRLRLPLPNFSIPAQMPFKRLLLTSNHVNIEGRLGASGYSVGVDGNFRLPGTEHGGTYNLKYRPQNTTGIPDKIVLTADTLTVSDAVNLVSSATVILPPGLVLSHRGVDEFMQFC